MVFSSSANENHRAIGLQKMWCVRRLLWLETHTQATRHAFYLAFIHLSHNLASGECIANAVCYEISCVVLHFAAPKDPHRVLGDTHRQTQTHSTHTCTSGPACETRVARMCCQSYALRPLHFNSWCQNGYVAYAPSYRLGCNHTHNTKRRTVGGGGDGVHRFISVSNTTRSGCASSWLISSPSHCHFVIFRELFYSSI